MTQRPKDSTREFEDFSDEVEELCRSELKKCLRWLEERVPLYGLDDTERSDLHRAPGEKKIWRPLRELLGTRRSRCAECSGVTIPRR